MSDTSVMQPSRLQWLVRLRFGLLVLLLLIVGLPFLPAGTPPPSDWIYFMGRFHPLVIHFPIVLVGLLLLLEILHRVRLVPFPPPLRVLLLGLAVISSVVAVSLGYLLYRTGEYSGSVLQLHLWSGMGVAIGTVVMLFLVLQLLRSSHRVYQRMYLLVLLATCGTTLFASHQGGSLTHGTEYLTEYLPTLQPVPIKSEEEMLVYQDVIVPMLDAKCYSCHNDYKTKGDLLMTNLADLTRGGKSGQPGLVPGAPIQSEIWKRVDLPTTHDDHMPPEGKPSLTPSEMQLLRWWIKSGADPYITYLEAHSDSTVTNVLTDYVAELKSAYRKQWKQELALSELVQQVVYEEAPYQINRDPENTNLVTLSMKFPTTAFNDESLVDLRPLYDQFSAVSVVGSDVSDNGLYHIGKMNQLRSLSLQKTGIDGSGLVYCAGLPQLEVLDLSFTNVTDANLLHLTKYPALKELYLYETAVSPAVVEALQAHLPDVTINLTRSPNY